MIIHIFSDQVNQNCISKIDITKGVEISIPQFFDQSQTNAYSSPPAESKPLLFNGFIGSVSLGGSCNCHQITIVPHCNGTHTENVSHLLKDIFPINKSLSTEFIKCTLIDIIPEGINDCNEHYYPKIDISDHLISQKLLRERLSIEKNLTGTKGLIIRTLPNFEEKKSKIYRHNESPFFSNEAMEYIIEMGFKHLLVDFPSVDRADDDGILSNHRIFFNQDIEKLKHNITPENTITELIYVPNSITEGDYWIQIQIPSFCSDAAPSRVFLFQELD